MNTVSRQISSENKLGFNFEFIRHSATAPFKSENVFNLFSNQNKVLPFVFIANFTIEPGWFKMPSLVIISFSARPIDDTFAKNNWRKKKTFITKNRFLTESAFLEPNRLLINSEFEIYSNILFNGEKRTVHPFAINLWIWTRLFIWNTFCTELRMKDWDYFGKIKLLILTSGIVLI